VRLTMGWLLRAPLLEPGERIIWKKKALMGPSTDAPYIRTSITGVLYVTSGERLLFVPNRGNMGRYMKDRAWRLSDVVDVGIQQRDWTPYTGGMQKRLRLTLKNGATLLFVLKKRDEAVRQLQTILASGS
jgi:hypothetical protein